MTTVLAPPVPQTAAHSDEQSPCPHQPPCPTGDASDREAARVIASCSQQGWSLLCNGVISFSDGGELLGDGTSIAPPGHTPAVHRRSR